MPPAAHAVPDDLALIARAVACSAGCAEDGTAASSVIRVPRTRGAREYLADAIPHSGAHRGPRAGARSLLGDLPAFGKVGFVPRHVAALGIDNGAVGAGCEAKRNSHEGEAGYPFHLMLPARRQEHKRNSSQAVYSAGFFSSPISSEAVKLPVKSRSCSTAPGTD